MINNPESTPWRWRGPQREGFALLASRARGVMPAGPVLWN